MKTALLPLLLALGLVLTVVGAAWPDPIEDIETPEPKQGCLIQLGEPGTLMTDCTCPKLWSQVAGMRSAGDVSFVESLQIYQIFCGGLKAVMPKEDLE